MNLRQSEKLSYLKRLLSIYIRFIPFDEFEVTVEMDNGKTYVKVEFFKQVTVLNSNNEAVVARNTKEKRYIISELNKVIDLYRKLLRTKFKSRHGMV